MGKELEKVLYINGQEFYIKRCSTSVVIKEMQNKIQWNTITPHPESLKLNELTNAPSVGKRGITGTLIWCWWECKLTQPPWKTVGSILEN